MLHMPGKGSGNRSDLRASWRAAIPDADHAAAGAQAAELAGSLLSNRLKGG
jgi:hypothetical protein